MSAPERDPDLEALLEFLRDERGFDFTGYKRPSLSRRITKRMQDVKVGGFAEYQRYLEVHSEEFAALFDTILINVTSFFRDPATWAYIEERIVPRVIANRDGDSIRIWSTGCASGEEAYTLAILFAEALGEDAFKRRVKIYATDVDDDALNFGRHGIYQAAQLEPVAPELRERYFERVNGEYAFRNDLRRAVIFGRHDLVGDPPISRIDLLVSRNTLMYFDAETQSDILARFHFALRPDGYLFLGKSEVLVARSPLFTAVDLRRRVFAKVVGAQPGDRPPRPTLEFSAFAATVDDTTIRDAGFEASPVAQVAIDREGRLVLANMHARMLFGLGHRDLGTLIQDLELSYRPVELRSRIEQVYAERHTISLRDVEWRAGPEVVRVVDVQLTPLTAPTGDLVGVAITFTDVTRYRRLQDALQDSKREVETAYEELQSTVEELETTNEELQSTNEELETTNEELQSTNEELETINDELQQRTDELNDLNAFLEGILGSLSAAVVVVDRELRVTAWNDAARDLWGLREDEVRGEHLLNLDVGFPVDALRKPLRDVLSGDGQEALVVDGVSRRGRPVHVSFRLAPLAVDGALIRGAILLMEVVAAQGAER